MNQIEWIGALSFLVISLAFLLVRRRLFLYHLLCWAAIGACGAATRPQAATGEWLLMVIALVLYWFGMLTVRVMVTRSVSLSLLAGYRDGRPGETIREDIAGRLQDARRFYLVSVQGDRASLTWFGHIITWIVVTGYWLLRIKR
jgi:hypothetical protein